MRATRSKLRQWWPECIAAALCVLTAATGQIGGAFAIALVAGIGWAMGRRHRQLGVHGKLDRMTRMIREMSDREAREDDDPRRPHLRVVP